MDETSIAFGWMVGKQIAGIQKKQDMQPIGYLYSGVTVPDVPEFDSSMVLPKLPEWDEGTYPKAFLVRTQEGLGIKGGKEVALICTKSPVDTIFIEAPAGEYRLFLIDMDAGEIQWEEDAASEELFISWGLIIPVWANYEMQGRTTYNGNYCDFVLTPTDPIPVYE